MDKQGESKQVSCTIKVARQSLASCCCPPPIPKATIVMLGGGYGMRRHDTTMHKQGEG